MLHRSIQEKGKFDRNYVTNRYYLEDAVFVVALSHTDDSFIDIIKGALKIPISNLLWEKGTPNNCRLYLR